LIEFDIIVIGGGINGITASAYLAKAGAKVCLLEHRDELGTHCSSEEVLIPGVRFNLHASALTTATFSPVMDDLELYKFGMGDDDIVMPEWHFFHHFKNNRTLGFNAFNAKKTYDKIARFSNHDAEVFKKITNYMGRKAEEFALRYYTPASLEAMKWTQSLVSGIPGYPEDSPSMTGFEMLDLLYEDSQIKAVLAGLAATGGFPWSRGTALITLFTSSVGNGMIPYHQCRGGSHVVPHTLFRCLAYHGGTILQSCTAEKIIIKDGEAKGVILSKDSAYPEKTIMAKKAVISNLTPHPTFMQLVGEEHLSDEAIYAIQNFNYDGQIMFRACYVTNELPKWSGADWDPDVTKNCWFYNYGAEDMSDLERLGWDLTNDKISDPLVGVGGSFVYDVADPTTAPPGLHSVLSFIEVPYDIRRLGGPEKWDELKDDLLEKITDRLTEYAPNLKNSIITKTSFSPLDIYRRNPSAIHGTFSGGPMIPGQLYLDRPFLGCGAPRTPIKNLYISRSIWPSGGSLIGTGYVAASVVASDLGIRDQPWWVHKPYSWWRGWLQRRGLEWKPWID
jgi:phytoene dehydrogenase-like protein